MLQAIITGAVVSKGFDGAEAIRYSESGKAVWFRIGKKVYDPQAEDHSRWVNFSIKGFGDMPDRVEKMQLKEGSFINLRGRLDEEVWTDKNDSTRRSVVIIAEDIEYAGGKPQEGTEPKKAKAQPAAPPAPEEPAGEFTGYEAFGGSSFFDED